MVSRLVLGCGGVGQRAVAAVADWPGSVRVVTEDEGRVETMRGENIRAEMADPADPDVLEGFAPVDVVLVAETDPDRALAIARAARETFPEATVLAYASLAATDDDRAALSAVVDRTIDAAAALGKFTADLVAGSAGDRAVALRRAIRGVDGRLAVVTHDNPDPDAIASAVALARIAAAVGVDAQPCYYGEISHQENRALVNLLSLDMRRLDPEEDLSEFAGFALVDHSRPGVNDQLPEDLAVDVVVDHHPPREPVEAEFVDLRSEVGATSTLLTNYLRRFDVEDYGGPQVATALLYGIRVDTADFSREATAADFEAAGTLLPYVDEDLLEQIESPAMTPDTIDTVGRAVENRVVRGSVLASCVGPLNDRDALAQAADRLLDMEGVTTTFVYGYDEDDSDRVIGADGADDPDETAVRGTVYASARTRGTDLDLGETLRLAFDDLGSAGGHADMAGAQLPLSSFSEVVEDGTVDGAALGDLMTETFFEAVEDRPPELVVDSGDVEESTVGPTHVPVHPDEER